MPRYQKADGHFGVEVDLKKPLLKTAPPILMLWGNARMLVGLVTAAEQFHDAELLASARRRAISTCPRPASCGAGA